MDHITVTTTVTTTLANAWHVWNDPECIKCWAFASVDWECPHAENDLRVGGTFLTRMAAKDGSFGFDFTGTYTDVQEQSHIAYVMDQSPEDRAAGIAPRTCSITFVDRGDGTVQVTETFDPEQHNAPERQRAGWQAILDAFKKRAEQ